MKSFTVQGGGKIIGADFGADAPTELRAQLYWWSAWCVRRCVDKLIEADRERLIDERTAQ